MNENIVQEPVTDVTENTVEQPVENVVEGIELTDTASQEEKKEVKSYTEEELNAIVNQRVNDILPSKIAKATRKIERQYKDKLSKYEETESILQAGLGTKDISESNEKMRQFYKEQGIEIPAFQKSNYSDSEEKILGQFEANEIIKLGFDDMQEEANRLADIGYDKLSKRDKEKLVILGKALTDEKNKQELQKLGVSTDLLNKQEFKDFVSQFNQNIPIKTVYELYKKTQPKPEVNTIGSMKNTDNSTVKDYYTDEEIDRLTPAQLKNPQIMKAVEKSMQINYNNSHK